jgi:hypothetical protein
MKVAAIMQPTYLPWVGYFDLLARSDVFVFLDTVQFAKRSWQQRNRIRTAQGVRWLTVPVRSRGRFTQTIAQVELDDERFVAKHLTTIEQAYARTPAFCDPFESLAAEMRVGAASGKLVELNISLIAHLARVLGIECKCVRSSALAGVGEAQGPVETLAALSQAVGAECYLAAAGSRDYLLADPAPCEERGIAIEVHAYQPAEYPQIAAPDAPFESYLSVIDLLFNVGPERAHELIAAGHRDARPG